MGRGKKYEAVCEKMDRETDYELQTAISFLKENPTETVIMSYQQAQKSENSNGYKKTKSF